MRRVPRVPTAIPAAIRGAGPSRKRRTGAALIGAGALAVLTAGPARADFTKGQELTILSLHSAMLAAQHCPYALDERQVGAFLSRKGLKRADLDASGRFSALLKDDMAIDDGRYAGDTAAACDQAWASFGPDGPMKNILRSK